MFKLEKSFSYGFSEFKLWILNGIIIYILMELTKIWIYLNEVGD